MLECGLDSGLKVTGLTLIPQRHGSAVGRAVAHQCQLLLLREAKKVTNIKKEQTRKSFFFFSAIPRIMYKNN